MLRGAALVTVVVLGLAIPGRAQTPVFKGGTDLVQVDVSVLDGKRRPVRGLTAADFVLLEDGQPRDIQAFTEVYLPDRIDAAAAPWVREVPGDVISNRSAGEEGRLVIIVMDRSIPVGEPTIRARRIAAAAVNALGPHDLAAIVSTSNGAMQNLTSDRTRLLRALNEGDPSGGISEDQAEVLAAVDIELNPMGDGRCLCGVCVMDTITRIAEAIQQTPRRRKLLFFVGSGLTLQARPQEMADDPGCTSQVKDSRTAMFAAVDRANLTVHSLDPSGLANVGPVSRPSSSLRIRDVSAAMTAATQEHLQRQGSLSVLPDRTGGRTIMNTNGPETQVDSIYRESDSYYLLGFRPAGREPGKVHSITVRSTRRNVDVRARAGYTTPPAEESGAPAPPGAAVSPALRSALTALLPGGDAALDLNAATFATPGSRRAAVVLTVGLGRFAGGDAKPAAATPIEVVAQAYDRRNRPVGMAKQTFQVARDGEGAGAGRRVDLLSRLDLPPGEYEIRVGVSSPADARTATVFSYVTVPAFNATPLSLSNIVVRAMPETVTAPKDFVAGLLPILPTGLRDFSASQQLIGFVRIYQGTGRTNPLVPVQFRTSILDAHGAVVASQLNTLQPAQFQKERAADHFITLPLAGLRPGDYLLQIQAEAGPRTAGRALRFRVQ